MDDGKRANPITCAELSLEKKSGSALNGSGGGRISRRFFVGITFAVCWPVAREALLGGGRWAVGGGRWAVGGGRWAVGGGGGRWAVAEEEEGSASRMGMSSWITASSDHGAPYRWPWTQNTGEFGVLKPQQINKGYMSLPANASDDLGIEALFDLKTITSTGRLIYR